jgi:hypothetical protein
VKSIESLDFAHDWKVLSCIWITSWRKEKKQVYPVQYCSKLTIESNIATSTTVVTGWNGDKYILLVEHPRSIINAIIAIMVVIKWRYLITKLVRCSMIWVDLAKRHTKREIKMRKMVSKKIRYWSHYFFKKIVVKAHYYRVKLLKCAYTLSTGVPLHLHITFYLAYRNKSDPFLNTVCTSFIIRVIIIDII